MTRSKKIFALFAVLFALLLVYIIYDISSRTTFPGQKSPEQIETDSARDAATSAPRIEPRDN